jgi:predicted nucleotidyltransferase
MSDAVDDYETVFSPELAHLTLRPMPDYVAADPTLIAFRDAIRTAGGERIDRLVLYGSRARGDQRPDSDYDFLVLAKPGENTKALWDDVWNAILTADALFDIEVNLFVKEHDFLGQRTIFTHNVRTDGVEL